MSTTIISSRQHTTYSGEFLLNSSHRHLHGNGARARPAASQTQTRGRILLNTRNTLLLICPLLPTEKPKDALSLPEELWRRILEYVLSGAVLAGGPVLPQSVLHVCKTFKSAAHPILYSSPRFSTLDGLSTFRDTLMHAETKWDALRRIPFSTPGRWVSTLDLSTLTVTSRLAFDTALTHLFPVTPCLATLALHPRTVLSSRALGALRESACKGRLKRLTGLAVPDALWFNKDPVTELLENLPALEELEIIGNGLDGLALEPIISGTTQNDIPALHLPNLRILSVIAATPSSPPFVALLGATLPVLVKLTMTLYHSDPFANHMAVEQALGFAGENRAEWLSPLTLAADLPGASYNQLFLSHHGTNVRSLTLLSAKDWPPVPFTLPTDLLNLCPEMEALTLVAEKQALDDGSLRLDLPLAPHPLRTLQLGRPNEDLLRCLEAALRTNATSAISISGRSPIANTKQESLLPHFTLVKFTAVRWLKLSASPHAINAGISGGMRLWKASLRRYGVKVIDADGSEA